MKIPIRSIQISYLSLWLSGVFLAFAALDAHSQYAVTFSRVYGGSLVDEGASVAVDEENDMILTGGRSFSTDGYLHENNSGSDYWIMQMNPLGDTIWSRSYGGFDNDDLRVIKYNAGGTISAFGTTWSDNTGDVPTHNGQVGAWLLVTDLAGNPSLSVVYSGMFGEQGIDFHSLPDGGYILLVQASSPILQGEMSHGNFDFWVARVNSIGEVIWSNFFGGADADVPGKLIRVTGGYIVIGSTASTNGDVTDNAGASDYWILKLDLEGNLLWQKTYGGSADDLARDGVVLNDGTIIVTGESESLDGDRTMAFGEKDIWTIALDENGDLLWEKSYGGAEDDAGIRLERAGQTRLALLGTTKSSNGNMTGNKGRQDAWLAYLQLDGIIRQQMNYGGSLDDYPADLVVTSDSIVYMVGSTLSNDGNLPQAGFPLEDQWLMRMAVENEPCADNNECFLFDDVNFAVLRPETNGSVVCINGCNAGAERGPAGPPGCTNFLGAAAWFKVKTDDEAEVLSISVVTPEFNRPQVLLMRGFNCLNFTPVNCNYGTEGIVTLINIPITPDTAYYIIVGDGSGLEGSFDLCVSVRDIDYCNRDPRIYVTETSKGSPFAGPFQPDENVQICYEINVWDKIDCNGLQGIVPEFGPGWDSTSFNSMGKPVSIDTNLIAVSPNGDWNWWPTGSVHYNFFNPVFGYAGGMTLPVGWYFVNENDPPPNEDPDESIGDIANCVNDTSRWKICFTLKTVSECTENIDASITIKSFADGEIGSIVSQACQSDPPVVLDRFVNCCLNPVIEAIPNLVLCSGDTLIITPESSLNPPVIYSWGVNINGNILGALPGTSNNIIFQQLTNLSDNPGTVTYTVRGTAQLCQTPFEEFTVTVLPQPTGSMSLIGPSTVCQGESIQVQFNFIGQAPFIAQIAIDGVLQEPILSETNSSIVEVPVTQSGLVTFVRFEDRSCGGNPNGAFPVTVLPPGEMTLNMSICEGDTAEVAGNKITFPGNYVFTLTDAASNGCDSIITLNLEVNENERTNLELQICEGESVAVGLNEYSETGVYSDTLETVHGCDSIVNLDLLVTNEIVVSTNRVICAGSSIEFGGETLFEDGTYYDTVAISATCDSIYILDLHVLNVIVLIQTVIEPDTGQSSGSIMIQVAGGIPPYSYLWSNGDTTNHPMNLDVGNYSLTVTDALGCIAEYNFFLISSTEDLLPGFEQILVYPNPVSENGDLNLAITRQTSDVQQITLQVQNLWGQVFYKQDALLSGEETLLKISNGKLVPGVYLVQLSDERGAAVVRRFVVQ